MNKDLFDWNVQPPLGFIHGSFYEEENFFSPHFEGDVGYHGILNVVVNEDKVVMVEFNEINHPDYYEERFSNISKRLSGYGFFQEESDRAKKTGIVLVNGITFLENQMLSQNKLTGEFDLLTGASNSLNRSMLVLAEKIEGRIKNNENDGHYYGYAKDYGNGITSRMQIVKSNSRIVSVFYDEIFANHPEDICDDSLKPFYRQSKYYSVDYGDSFKNLWDKLALNILDSQCLNVKPEGFSADETKRIEELAKILEEAMK